MKIVTKTMTQTIARETQPDVIYIVVNLYGIKHV